MEAPSDNTNTKNTKPKRKTRAQVRAETERARKRRIALIAGAVVIAVLVAGGLIWSNRDSSDLPTLQVADAAELSGIPTDGRVIGDPNATVHLIEYGDYQCPACASFATQAFPELLSGYIAPGKVSFEFRDLAFLGDDSVTAAQAAACAIPQDGFWLYHDTIYDNHYGENLGNLSKSRLLDMAELSGLDRDQIASCLDDGTTAAEVQAMHQEATQLGVASTPSFVLNGELIQWQGWDAMKQSLDAALANQ